MQQKREIGRSGIKIAPLVLGGNVFGWNADQATPTAVDSAGAKKKAKRKKSSAAVP